MKKLILFVFIGIGAIGQQTPADGSKATGSRAPGNSDSKTTGRVATPKIERCGLGSKHECHCLQRTEAIHNKIIATCEKDAKTSKQRDECLRREMIPHCAMAETFTKWDTETSAARREDGDYDMHSGMGPMCTMACLKHRCECADGPKCDFGMSKEDSAQADREGRKGR
jgi:hypothetical protein